VNITQSKMHACESLLGFLMADKSILYCYIEP